MSRNYKFHNKSGLYFVSFASQNDESVTFEMEFFTESPNPELDMAAKVYLDNINLQAAIDYIEPKLAFYYDDRGQRIRKEIYNNAGTNTTYYVRDAAGSVMGIYNKQGTTTTLNEHPIYGVSRVGVHYRQDNTDAYQLTDHLGNVRSVIIKQGDNAAAITSKTDYYPFGMAMPNRNLVSNYRYAFQGQEKDPETGKEAFQLRLWDSRIGRWLTVDPAREFFSPYLGMGNNPITRTDHDGGCDGDASCSCIGVAEMQNLPEVVVTAVGSGS